MPARLKKDSINIDIVLKLRFEVASDRIPAKVVQKEKLGKAGELVHLHAVPESEDKSYDLTAIDRTGINLAGILSHP